MANTNRVHQRQVKATRAEFDALESQLNHVESRTRQKATIRYEVKTQWDQGDTLTNIDTDTTLDKIQLAESVTPGEFELTGEFVSYVLDVGATDVKFDSLTITHTKPAGTSIAYFTRTGPSGTPDGNWTAWVAVNSENEILSDNGRYIQFKIQLSTSNNLVTPVVDSVGVVIWGTALLQEVIDARGPYKSVSERFDQLDSVYILKIIPGNGDTEITIPKVISDGATFKVWINGQLMTEGDASYDAYQLSISGQNTLVTFSSPFAPFDGGDVVVCRIEGAGAGVLTVKENIIVDESPTTSDYITFTLIREPIPGKEEVYAAGIKMVEGSENDYTLSGKDVIFNYEVNSNLAVTVTYYYY